MAHACSHCNWEVKAEGPLQDGGWGGIQSAPCHPGGRNEVKQKLNNTQYQNTHFLTNFPLIFAHISLFFQILALAVQ